MEYEVGNVYTAQVGRRGALFTLTNCHICTEYGRGTLILTHTLLTALPKYFQLGRHSQEQSTLANSSALRKVKTAKTSSAAKAGKQSLKAMPTDLVLYLPN